MRHNLPDYPAPCGDVRVRCDVNSTNALSFVMALLSNCLRFESLEDLHAHQKYRLSIGMLPFLERETFWNFLQKLAKFVRKSITCGHDWHSLTVGSFLSVRWLRSGDYAAYPLPIAIVKWIFFDQ